MWPKDSKTAALTRDVPALFLREKSIAVRPARTLRKEAAVMIAALALTSNVLAPWRHSKTVRSHANSTRSLPSQRGASRECLPR